MSAGEPIREEKGARSKPRGFPWLAAALVAATAVACGVLVRIVQSASMSLDLYYVDASRAAPLRLPEWVPAEWIEEAKAAVARHAVFSMFDEKHVNGLREDLAALPWVKQVRVMTREIPRSLRFALEPRAPRALVRYGERWIVLDADAVVLPPGTFAEATLRDVPRLLGVDPARSKEAPVTGVAWRDPGVSDGMSVVRSLDRLPLYARDVRVEAIDVTNVGGRVDGRETEILLVTAGGTRIKWGRAPRAAKFGEIAPDVKFANLARVARAYPGLDGVSCVNLRFDRPDVFDASGQWIREIPEPR